MPLPEYTQLYRGEVIRALGELRSDDELLTANPGLDAQFELLHHSVTDISGYTAPFPENPEKVDMKQWYLDCALTSLKHTNKSIRDFHDKHSKRQEGLDA